MSNFTIEGVDVEDGSRVTLHECGTSGEARRWLSGYTKGCSSDAGGWQLIEVYDTRNEDEAERIFVWEGGSVQGM